MKRTRLQIVTVLMVAIGLVVGCSSGGGGGGGADMAAPISTAQEAYVALTAGDFEAYVGYLHPESVKEFENMVQPVLNALAPTDSLGNPVDSMNIFGTWRQSEAFMQQPPDTIFVQVMSSIFEVAPEIKSTFSSIENEFVGGVMEADTAFLVTRTTLQTQGRPFTEMNVVAMTLSDGDWKMQMPTQVRGVLDLAMQSLMRPRG